MGNGDIGSDKPNLGGPNSVPGGGNAEIEARPQLTEEELKVSSYHLKFYIRGVHKNDKTHFCKHCGKYFADEVLLKHHTYQSHSKVTCPYCKKLILNQYRLKRHLALEHDVKDGAYFCEICPKTVFFSEFHFNKHMVGKHCKFNRTILSY